VVQETGEPIVGLSSAASYYFGKAPEDLSASEFRYLLCSSPSFGLPETLPKNATRISRTIPLVPTAYDYVGLNPPADTTYMVHDGMIRGRFVVGSVITKSNGTQPFLWQDGVYKLIPGPSGALRGLAVGVNDAGSSVGWYNEQAAEWDAQGHSTELGALSGYGYSRAMAINSSGQIVGYVFNQTSDGSPIENPSRAVLWDHGHMVELGMPADCLSSRAYAINDSGEVAGFLITDDDKTHACTWTAGVVRDLGVFPDGNVSRATSINNEGMVVGQGNHYDGSVSAFVWQNGALHDLGTLPGDKYSKANSINDLGEVVGESMPSTSDVNVHGDRPFVWDLVDGMRDIVPEIVVDRGTKIRLSAASAVYSISNNGDILGVVGIHRGDPSVSGRQVNFVLVPAHGG
jgi:probable HAF family extracellular repeat protein